jgi:hypothetical protein
VTNVWVGTVFTSSRNTRSLPAWTGTTST